MVELHSWHDARYLWFGGLGSAGHGLCRSGYWRVRQQPCLCVRCRQTGEGSLRGVISFTVHASGCRYDLE